MALDPRLTRAARALVLALAAQAAAAADTMRCDGGLVGVGDSKLDLLGKCGSPTDVETRPDERGGLPVLALPAPPSLRVSVTVERWTYDFGPDRFIQVVTLDTGRIVAVASGSYGFSRVPRPPPPPLPRAACEPSALHAGDARYAVLARCGPPATRDVRLEQEVIWAAAPDGGPPVPIPGRTVEVEVWAYDFGPRTFVRLVTLADGLVVKVETGGYGYAR